jgi:heptosyltransferase-3
MTQSLNLPADAELLAICVARIGDTLLVTPALAALKAAVPKGRLTCLAHPKRMEVLEGLEFIDQLGSITKQGAPLRGRLGRRFDAAVVWGNDEELIRYALRVARRVTAFRQADAALDRQLRPSVAHPVGALHAVEHRLLPVLALGLEPVGRRLRYRVGAEEAAWAGQWLRRLPATARRLVVIQAASFPTKAYRDWPETGFRELIGRLLERVDGSAVILLGDAADRPRAERLAAGFGPRVAVAAGTTSLRQSAALIGQASLYVGVDTGFTHVAGALGVPMVALYHCLHPGRYLAPPEHPAYLSVIEHPATGGACSERNSMAEISVDSVWRRVEEALGAMVASGDPLTPTPESGSEGA